MHFILAGHGKQAIEIVNAAEMVFGQMDQIDVVTFLPGENVDNLKEKYRNIINRYPEAEEILFLVDLYGGSPYNAAFEIVAGEERMDVITGLNLPMLIDAAGIRMTMEDMKASEVYEQLMVDSYVCSCKEILKKVSEEKSEEDDEL